MAHDNQLVCRSYYTKEILKQMDIEESQNHVCENYDEDNEMSDPFN